MGGTDKTPYDYELLSLKILEGTLGITPEMIKFLGKVSTLPEEKLVQGISSIGYLTRDPISKGHSHVLRDPFDISVLFNHDVNRYMEIFDGTSSEGEIASLKEAFWNRDRDAELDVLKRRLGEEPYKIVDLSSPKDMGHGEMGYRGIATYRFPIGDFLAYVNLLLGYFAFD